MIKILIFLLALTTTVNAQGGMAPGPGTAHSTGGGGGTLTFGIDGTNNSGIYTAATSPMICPSTDCLVSGSSSTQFGISTASSNRVVIAGFGAGTFGTNSAVSDVKFNGTISGADCTGGVQATKAVDTPASTYFTSIWYAAVSSGTTVTVCYRMLGGNGWNGGGVVTVAYLNDSLGAASISVSSTQAASPPAMPGNCGGGTCVNTWSGTTVPSGGVGIGVGTTVDLSSSSWSGTASPTKDAENNNASVTVPFAHWSTSGNVTETVSTGSQAGWAGVIFAP